MRRCPGFPIENVVFMAAAESVREFDRDVLSYLGAHANTRFYNLTLHPSADRFESTPIRRFFLHGSLLAWLDGSLNDLETDEDRAIGRYETAISALHLIPDSVRGRVYLKGFGYGGEQNHFYAGGRPYQHSHFGEARLHFWRCDFWTPATAMSDCAPAPTIRASEPSGATRLVSPDSSRTSAERRTCLHVVTPSRTSPQKPRGCRRHSVSVTPFTSVARTVSTSAMNPESPTAARGGRHSLGQRTRTDQQKRDATERPRTPSETRFRQTNNTPTSPTKTREGSMFCSIWS